MALFSSLFKVLGKKKEEPKAPSAPMASPASSQPVSHSPSGKTAAGKAVPDALQKPMQFDEIIAALQQIESIMAEPVGETAPADVDATSDPLQTVALGLSDLIQIVPSSFNKMPVAFGDRAEIVIENLFSQMSRGKIETTLGCLLAGVPKQYLVNVDDLKSEVKVSLPLPLIVAAIDPDDLKKRTAQQPPEPMTGNLPDLFERADQKEAPKPAEAANPTAPAIPVPNVALEASPKVESKAPPIPEAKSEPQPEEVPKSELRIESRIEPKPTSPTELKPVAAAPAKVSVSGAPVLLLKGLDLNQVSAEELMRVVDGIGESMAQRIVEDRTQNGPFFGLYDLGRVPGIGSKIYEKITSQPWLEEKYGQLQTVDEILGRWTGRHPDLGDVTAKFKAIPGFEGCMILHRDGHLLATSWQIESPDRLQAMAPQMLKKVKHYMRYIVQGETYSVTIFIEGFSFTFVESEDICFVAVHNPKGLSRRHIQIVNGLGVALGRRFSGYRGA